MIIDTPSSIIVGNTFVRSLDLLISEAVRKVYVYVAEWRDRVIDDLSALYGPQIHWHQLQLGHAA
jgi:hypothetical protein